MIQGQQFPSPHDHYHVDVNITPTPTLVEWQRSCHKAGIPGTRILLPDKIRGTDTTGLGIITYGSSTSLDNNIKIKHTENQKYDEYTYS